MGKVGKISSIKKEYNKNTGTLESSLAAHGYYRFPNTGVSIGPVNEINNLDVKTGLNIKAPYMERMKKENPERYKAEVKRITELKIRLEEELGISLDPRSPFYTKIFDETVTVKATRVKLKDGDNIYNLSDPLQAVTYEWLKVHPLIASSFQAWEKGEYPASTQFFVNDEDIEEELQYKKKTLINRAIGTLEDLSLDKRKKVARLLGLPISEDSKERFVYNLLDTFIKQPEVKSGDYKGTNPVDLFNKFANMEDKLLSTKDLIEQAIKHSIYRTTKGGKITEGSTDIAKSKEELLDFLLSEKNQDDLFALEEKLKVKKSTI